MLVLMSPPLVLWAGAPVYPLIHRPPLVPGCAEVAEGVEAVTVRVPRPGHVQHPAAVQCVVHLLNSGYDLAWL